VDSDSEDRPGRGQTVSPDIGGTVTEQLPSALYRVRLDDGGSIVAHIADRIDRNFIRVLIGDRVRVERSRADVTRGRIVGKLG
jgi:translation initiation factor IF-1